MNHELKLIKDVDRVLPQEVKILTDIDLIPSDYEKITELVKENFKN